MHSEKVTTLTLESIDRHLSSLSARGRSNQTVRAYGSDLREFLRWARISPIPMTAFEETAMMWLNSQRELVAPKTTGRRLSSLRSFAKWCGMSVLDEYVAPTPARPMPHPLPEGMEGVRRMIEAATDVRHKAIVAFGGLVGCRIAETLAITPGEFSMGEMTLTIRGKGDKRRIVPVSEEAWDVVQRPVLDTAVFSGMQRQVIDYQDRFARKIVTDLGVKAGLSRPVSSHDLRMTFGSAVYEKTKDLRATQELLGHASSSTTELYTFVRLDTMREAVNEL